MMHMSVQYGYTNAEQLDTAKQLARTSALIQRRTAHHCDMRRLVDVIGAARMAAAANTYIGAHGMYFHHGPRR